MGIGGNMGRENRKREREVKEVAPSQCLGWTDFKVISF